VNQEAFAFFNEQLANMLRDGIPLEGAVAELSRSMRRGRLRAELDALRARLAAGTPLDEALAETRLPPLYASMVRVGVKANNLPAVLTMLADHYRNVGTVLTRLKGIMVYPVIVLALTLGLSLFMALYLAPAFADFCGEPSDLSELATVAYSYRRSGPPLGVQAVAAPALLTGMLVLAVVAVSLPWVRRWLRWRLSPLKEASLAQLASGVALMLRGGSSLSEALALQQEVEGGTLAARDLASISSQLAGGATRFGEMAQDAVALPRLFIWMVDNAGEDMAGGFERAAALYRARASHRTEMLLYAALPCSILVLGGMLVAQVYSVLLPLLRLMAMLGGGGF